MKKEAFLQYIWKNALFDTDSMRTVSDKKVELLDAGRVNDDAGPDFFNVKMRIGGVLWVGNVEVHVRASDWDRHRHNEDSAYDNVVLHVVEVADKDVFTSLGRMPETMVLNYDENLLREYEHFFKGRKRAICLDRVSDVNDIAVRMWIEGLAVDRLERKVEEIERRLNGNKNSWDETFYQMLARYFGANVNAEPFELLARELPMRLLLKNKDSENVIECLMFGQAGLLNDEDGDEYYLSLRRDYLFYRRKYNLTALPNGLWKYLRLRPYNFPDVRIAQFANLVYGNDPLFSAVIETECIEDLYNILDASASKYWDRHFRLNCESGKRKKRLGNLSKDVLIINAVVPVVFAYGRLRGRDDLKERAMDWLEKIRGENNTVVKRWQNAGYDVKSAVDSQALLELESKYCSKHRCLNCYIGDRFFKKII